MWGRPSAQQAVVIAVICAAVDTGSLLVAANIPDAFRVPGLVMIVLLDAALILPVRWSGWLAVAGGAAQPVMAVLFGASPGVRNAGVAGGVVIAYRAGAWLGGRRGVMAIFALAAGAAAADLIGGSYSWRVAVVDVGTTCLLPWLVGAYNTTRQSEIDALRLRQAQERDAVERERALIAHDLHDTISHHVSAIGIHAGVARMALANPATYERAGGSLSEVETSTRSAMADLRTLLDVLHGTPDPNDRPSLDGIEDLLNGLRRSGQLVRFTMEGESCSLPGPLDVALYRIAQEMLTNALRHGTGPIDLSLTYSPSGITLAANNAVGEHPPHPSGPGHGLAGIRRRAAMFGGTVTYGPEPGDRWRTAVTAPTEPS